MVISIFSCPARRQAIKSGLWGGLCHQALRFREYPAQAGKEKGFRGIVEKRVFLLGIMRHCRQASAYADILAEVPYLHSSSYGNEQLVDSIYFSCKNI